ncbi:MAG: hypothetical protein ACTSU5_05055 [Promethearchaeota archaeon]
MRLSNSREIPSPVTYKQTTLESSLPHVPDPPRPDRLHELEARGRPSGEGGTASSYGPATPSRSSTPTAPSAGTGSSPRASTRLSGAGPRTRPNSRLAFFNP